MTLVPEVGFELDCMDGACAAQFRSMVILDIVFDYGTPLEFLLVVIVVTMIYSGTVIALLRLNGTMNKPVRLPSYNIINTLVMIGVLAFGAHMVFSGTHSTTLLYLLFASALVYGILFTIPIGGADMPVVISLLN